MGDPTSESVIESSNAELRELVAHLKASLEAAAREREEIIKKKDEEFKNLLNELKELRKQVALLLDREVANHRSESKEPSDSSFEEEGSNITTEEEMEEDDASAISSETLTVVRKNRKTRRAERFSSDEESSAKGAPATPTGSPVRSPRKQRVKTTEAAPSKSAKKSRVQVSNQLDFNTEDFPSLPPPSPTAGNSAATPVLAASQAAKPKANSSAATSQSTSQITKRPQRPKQIPPIVISNAGKFVSISSMFRTNNVRYTSAVVVRNGIKIFPASEPDFRKATDLLEKNKEPYFTFRFPEEKPIHVVLRGVPIHLTTEKVAEDLISQGFRPKKVVRWLYADGNPMPMVLVLLPKAETNIYKVRSICTFDVRAEARKSKPRSTQCYNCQDHGHAAPCCHIPAKCVKCGESHHTSQCKKSREDPPKCANCAGDHPASFSGCPRHPTQLRPKVSNFRGWGTQDNSRLAPTPSQKQPPRQAPAPASNEAVLSPVILAQLSQLIAVAIRDQLNTLRAPVTDRRT